ncbi:MAG: mono/diheme cytochrome c family protein [Acidimicrobiales bacterium]|jgi:mono/diheme cytochrome c family protein
MDQAFLTGTALLAADFRVIGLTVFTVVIVGFVALFIRNMLEARAELGSEIELAANKKEYLSDEDLEGSKLDKSLSFALVTLGVCSLALPFYWLAEPGRQEGAVDAYQLNFESRGEGLYLEGAQCVNCHSAGGAGGSAPYVLQDGDGQFVANAAWNAPALDDVLLRYSEDEVRYILNFGRPGSPMAAWGTPGGGPLTTQQVQNLIEYIDTFQVQTLDTIAINESSDPDASNLAAEEVAAAIYTEVDRSIEAGEFETVGEAVFNLGLFSDFRNGSLSCARCHTAGWSLGAGAFPDLLSDSVSGCGGGNPSGIGFNLCSGSTRDRFPDDSWKQPNGDWLPAGGFTDDDGRPYILSLDEQRIFLNEKGAPVTERTDDAGNAVLYLIIEGGDVADCLSISNLWEPETGEPYAYDASIPVAYDSELSSFIDPDRIAVDDFDGDAFTLADGRIVSECTVVEMPDRTSQAHYDFVYSGADAGAGYGQGGQSHAGMMPSFGGSLPPDLIQAVVDYERGL